MKWFRVYDDIIDDPKILRLSPENRWNYVGILSISSRQSDRGSLPSVSDIALHLRISEAKTRKMIASLIEAGLIDQGPPDKGLRVHGWDNRQFKSDDATQRWREHVSRKGANVGQTLAQTEVKRTRIRTETETETESEGESPLPPFETLPKTEDEWAKVADAWVVSGDELEPFDPGPPEKPIEPLSPELQKVFDVASEVAGDVGWGTWAVRRVKLGDKPEWIEPALRRAVDQNALRTSYVGGVLEGFRRDGGPRSSPPTIPFNGKRRDGPTNMPPEIPPDTRTAEEKAAFDAEMRRHLDECRRRNQQRKM